MADISKTCNGIRDNQMQKLDLLGADVGSHQTVSTKTLHRPIYMRTDRDTAYPPHTPYPHEKPCAEVQPQDTHLLTVLNSFAVAMEYQWDACHDMESLQRAIEARRECVKIRPVQSLTWPALLHDLGFSLLKRFSISGEHCDLQEAQSLLEECLREGGSHCADYALWLSTLSYAHYLEYLKLDSQQHLLYAIEHANLSVQHMRADDPRQALYLKRAATFLQVKCKRGLSLTDDALNTVIDLWERAFKLSSLAGHYRAPCLSGLSFAYRTRYFAHAHQVDAEKAMAYQLELLHSAGGFHAHVEAACGMASTHLMPGFGSYNVTAALGYIWDAVRHTESDLFDRLPEVMVPIQELAKRQHLNLMSLDQLAELLNIYEHLLNELRRCAFYGADARARLNVLRRTEFLSLGAAQLALMTDQPERAVEYLERGRAMFWSRFGRLSTHDYKGLRELRMLAHRRYSAHKSDNYINPHTLIALARDQAQFRVHFDALVSQARTVPTLERMLTPEAYSVISRAADAHPVVVLVAGLRASYAVILMPDKSSPIMVNLDKMPSVRLHSLVERLKNSSHEDRGLFIRSPRAMVITRQKYKPDGVRNVLQTLWANIMWPVVKRIGFLVSSHTICA